MMESMPNLRTALLDLLFECRNEDLRLIVGGGYGIFLKREHVRQLETRTLFREWPEARSTNDIDLFLRPELLIRPAQLRPMREALHRMGYLPVRGAENYQFAKPGPTGGRDGGLKIDLLTGPRSRFRDSGAIVDERRIRPRPSVDLHAHPVDEAPTLEDGLRPITMERAAPDDSKFEATIYLPHPLTFAMMKLFAFRDRFADENKQFGSYHALDVYTVLATATEEEWDGALKMRDRHQANEYVQEAARIANEYFASPKSPGMLRMRESPYCRDDLLLNEFCDALRDLFPPPAPLGS